MFQLSEEQAEEIQVLESIYGDAFTRKSFSNCFYLNIFADDKDDVSRYLIDLDTTVGKVTLKIKLVEEYPMVLPEMDISSSSHKLVVHDLLKALKQEVLQKARFYFYF